jgi:hypothetical protein
MGYDYPTLGGVMEPSFFMLPQLFGQIPVLKASELHNISEAFATELIAKLDRFNTEHPEAMSGESNAPINRLALHNLPLPTPLKFRGAFESAFCRYAASRCIIIPG